PGATAVPPIVAIVLATPHRPQTLISAPDTAAPDPVRVHEMRPQSGRGMYVAAVGPCSPIEAVFGVFAAVTAVSDSTAGIRLPWLSYRSRLTVHVGDAVMPVAAAMIVTSVARPRSIADDGYSAGGVSPQPPEFPAALMVVGCPEPDRHQIRRPCGSYAPTGSPPVRCGWPRGGGQRAVPQQPQLRDVHACGSSSQSPARHSGHM